MCPGVVYHSKKHPVNSTKDHKPVAGVTGDNIVVIDPATKLPIKDSGTSLASILGGLIPQGLWNANTNTPALADGVGTLGHFYLVSVAGTQDLGSGPQTFNVNDWVLYDQNDDWKRVDNSDPLIEELRTAETDFSKALRVDKVTAGVLEFITTSLKGNANKLGNNPPGVPTDKYTQMVMGSPTGAFIGHANTLAVYKLSTTSWSFYSPAEGDTYYSTGESDYYVFSSGTWSSLWTLVSWLNISDRPDVVDRTEWDATTFMYALADNTPLPKTPAEVMAILSGEALVAFDLNMQNLINCPELHMINTKIVDDGTNTSFVNDQTGVSGFNYGIGLGCCSGAIFHVDLQADGILDNIVEQAKFIDAGWVWPNLHMLSVYSGYRTSGDIAHFEAGTSLTTGRLLCLRSNSVDRFQVDKVGRLTLPAGTDVDEFSTDGTLAGDSDDAVPTEKAVKTYIDTNRYTDAEAISAPDPVYAESLGLSTYTGTAAYQTKTSLALTVDGTYIVTASFQLGGTKDDKEFQAELHDGAAQLDFHNMVPQKKYNEGAGKNHFPNNSMMARIVVSGASKTISLRYATTDTGQTVAIQNAKLYARRIA